MNWTLVLKMGTIFRYIHMVFLFRPCPYEFLETFLAFISKHNHRRQWYNWLQRNATFQRNVFWSELHSWWRWYPGNASLKVSLGQIRVIFCSNIWDLLGVTINFYPRYIWVKRSSVFVRQILTICGFCSDLDETPVGKLANRLEKSRALDSGNISLIDFFSTLCGHNPMPPTPRVLQAQTKTLKWYTEISLT